MSAAGSPPSQLNAPGKDCRHGALATLGFALIAANRSCPLGCIYTLPQPPARLMVFSLVRSRSFKITPASVYSVT